MPGPSAGRRRRPRVPVWLRLARARGSACLDRWLWTAPRGPRTEALAPQTRRPRCLRVPGAQARSTSRLASADGLRGVGALAPGSAARAVSSGGAAQPPSTPLPRPPTRSSAGRAGPSSSRPRCVIPAVRVLRGGAEGPRAHGFGVQGGARRGAFGPTERLPLCPRPRFPLTRWLVRARSGSRRLPLAPPGLASRPGLVRIAQPSRRLRLSVLLWDALGAPVPPAFTRPAPQLAAEACAASWSASRAPGRPAWCRLPGHAWTRPALPSAGPEPGLQ